MYNYKIVIYDESNNIKDEQFITAHSRLEAFHFYESKYGRIGVNDSFDAILISFY